MLTKFKNYQKQTLTIANRDENVKALLGDKTIGEIGHTYELEGDEFEFEEKPNPKDPKQTIRNMYLRLNGHEYQIAISRNFNWDKRFDADWLLNCEFYHRPMSMLNEAGEAVMGENGQPLYYDGNEGRALRTTIVLGNPSGLTKGDNVEKAFSADSDEKANVKKANASIGA